MNEYNPQTPNQIPGAPPFYWLARVMDEDRSAAVKQVVKGVDRAIDHFGLKLDTMQSALGLIRQRDPALRLAAYYDKPDTVLEAEELVMAGLLKVVYSWESQRMRFPRDYEEDWEDFQKLRVRAAKGELGVELQADEAAYAAQSLDAALEGPVL